MDYTENALNKAHRYIRKAEDFDRIGHYTFAIDCHREAIDQLNRALSQTSHPAAKQSIQLQIQHQQMLMKLTQDRKLLKESLVKLQHQSQQNYYLKLQQQQLEEQKKAKVQESNMSLQSEIYRKIDQHDSLLKCLMERDEGVDQVDSHLKSAAKSQAGSSIEDSGCSRSESITLSTCHNSYNCGTKLIKDDKTVIEELAICNAQLKGLVFMLMDEKELLAKENRELKQRLSCQEHNLKMNVKSAE